MRVLGIHGFAGSDSHDASAALVVDGRVVFATEEERFVRAKHAKGLSPIHAAAACLQFAGLRLDEIDAIAAGWHDGDGDVERVRHDRRGAWLDTVLPAPLFPSTRVPPVYFVKHHLAHIAAGFFLSNFRDALCLCVDGQGECASSTLAIAGPDGIRTLCSFPRRYSLGALYEAASSYSGLGYDVPGKLMGLAPFGSPIHPSPLTFEPKTASFVLHPGFALSDTADAFEVVAETERFLLRKAWPYARGGPNETMLYADVAASAQAWVQDAVVSLSCYGQQLSRQRSLVLTGGVALNCTINGAVEREGIFDRIFVPPGPNDASCSVGAALLIAHHHIGSWIRYPSSGLASARLGLSYDPDRIDHSLRQAGLKAACLNLDELASQVADDLASNAMVAWFQGRSEFGPRALGGRSLLCSAASRDNHRRVNAAKGREHWRPLAPSVLTDSYSEFFADTPSRLSRFMLKAVPVRQSQRCAVPAIVHVDGTSRPHAVDAQDAVFYELLLAYRDRTGIPLVINTSLNGPGEPIVETPSDAINFFNHSPLIDVLVLGDRYVRRG